MVEPGLQIDRPNPIPALISGSLLFLAVFGRFPYGFYTAMRLVVCGSAVYLAFSAAMLKKNGWAWVMGGIAVLFNPLIPVHMRRSDWQPVDLIVAVVFLLSLALIKRS